MNIIIYCTLWWKSVVSTVWSVVWSVKNENIKHRPQNLIKICEMWIIIIVISEELIFTYYIVIRKSFSNQ